MTTCLDGEGELRTGCGAERSSVVHMKRSRPLCAPFQFNAFACLLRCAVSTTPERLSWSNFSMAASAPVLFVYCTSAASAYF